MLGHIVWSSKNVPTNFAICPEPLINNFGIIKDLKNKQHINELRTIKKSHNLFAVFWALLSNQTWMFESFSETIMISVRPWSSLGAGDAEAV